MVLVNPLFSRRYRRRYKDNYSLESYEDTKREKWDTFITAFLEDDNGNPPQTRVVIQTYARRNDIDPHDAEVDERSVWVNLNPEDAVCFVHDLMQLLSGLFDLHNHIPYDLREEYDIKLKPKKEKTDEEKKDDEEDAEYHNPIFNYEEKDKITAMVESIKAENAKREEAKRKEKMKSASPERSRRVKKAKPKGKNGKRKM